MCEDVCRSAYLAHQLGDPVPIAQSDIDALTATKRLRPNQWRLTSYISYQTTPQ